MMTHPNFLHKLEAIGYGVFVPFFFARGLPALLYRPLVGALIAGLLQSTSLPFIVVASQIGVELGMLGAATGAALVAAGLLSVLVFPITALTLLRRGTPEAGP